MTSERPTVLLPYEQEERLLQIMGDLTPKQKGAISVPYFVWYYFDTIIPEHQDKWFERIQSEQNLLLLTPRSHGKTTTVARFYVEWYSLYHSNTTTLLFGKTDAQSLASLDVINSDLTTNEKLKKDFAYELREYHKKGNSLYFNRDKIIRDGTVEANGLLGAVTGSHYSYIVCDDLVDDENTRTPMQMAAVSKWFNGTVTPLADSPDTKMTVIGTRKHYEDLYAELIEHKMWYVIHDKAFLEFPDDWTYLTNREGTVIDVEWIGDGEVLWPEKWGIRELLMKRYQVGTIYFDREYQNDPSGISGNLLHREWLHFYDRTDIFDHHDTKLENITKELIIYQVWDLAIGDSPSSDYTVCITFGVSRDNKIYVLDIMREHLSFPDQLRKVIELYDEWKPILVGIESNTYQAALPEMVLELQIMPIQQIYSSTNKEQRIILGSVNYENGKILLPAWKKITDFFIKEYTDFPKGANDDMIDCMQMGVDMVRNVISGGDLNTIVGAGSND